MKNRLQYFLLSNKIEVWKIIQQFAFCGICRVTLCSIIFGQAGGRAYCWRK